MPWKRGVYTAEPTHYLHITSTPPGGYHWLRQQPSPEIYTSDDWSTKNTTKWKSQHRIVPYTVYPKKYAHGFVVLCFVVVMQPFIMNSHEVFIHIHQRCFAGTGAIVRLPQCQWSKPDGYGKISQCMTTTKHSKAKTVCIFRGIYCIILLSSSLIAILVSFLQGCCHLSMY